jgi:UDP-N-acetylmuramoyl-tripeptide--D-alanyl-D-alanine ligase
MKRTLAQFAARCGGVLRGADREFAEVVIDSRRVATGDLFCALPGTRTDGHGFLAQAAAAGAAAALVSRPVDVALAQIKVADVAQGLVQAARAWRGAFRGPLIGVAGSNGKTTTKEMLAAILAQRGPCLATLGNLNNQLGVPLTLLRLTPQHTSAVIEMGANRAGDVAELACIAAPGIGLITNAGAEHLEGFGSLEGVARAEGEMVAALKSEGAAIINADDPYAPLWRGMTRARVVGFGLGSEAEVRATELRLGADERGFVTRFTLHAALGSVPVELALAGRHNVYNALGAAAAAVAAGASLAQVAAGLASMRAVAGRLQFRLGHAGAWLIDDSYNANPSSVSAALQVLAGLPGRRWLVLGDMAELGEHAEASHRDSGAQARAAGVERLYTFGPLAALAADSFGSGAECYSDINQLSAALNAALQPDVRLLIKGSRVNRLERLVAALTDAPPARRAG